MQGIKSHTSAQFTNQNFGRDVNNPVFELNAPTGEDGLYDEPKFSDPRALAFTNPIYDDPSLASSSRMYDMTGASSGEYLDTSNLRIDAHDENGYLDTSNLRIDAPYDENGYADVHGVTLQDASHAQSSSDYLDVAARPDEDSHS